ncbi:unnamed protein product [Owenia fusiformis]|uniref:Uncharacterized protein n=1 Tax=Owenia fusiformis TaxID=6347 RepID=A0A8J1UZX1_OWEFU|nr:unnamed protein product [Owenia fusiformis]
MAFNNIPPIVQNKNEPQTKGSSDMKLNWKQITFIVVCVAILIICIVGVAGYMGVKEMQFSQLQGALFREVKQPDETPPPKKPKPKLRKTTTTTPIPDNEDWLIVNETADEERERKGGIQPTGDFTEIALRLRQMRFNPAFRNPESRGFKQLSNNFCSKIGDVYASAGIGQDIRKCWVITLQEGSVIVTFGLEFNRQIHFKQLMVPLKQAAARKGGVLNKLKVFPNEIIILSLYDDPDIAPPTIATQPTTTTTEMPTESTTEMTTVPNTTTIPPTTTPEPTTTTTRPPDPPLPLLGQGLRLTAQKNLSRSGAPLSPIPDTDSSFCEDLMDGLYTNPSNCSKFVVCRGGNGTILSCPDDAKNFNPLTGECDKEECIPSRKAYRKIYYDCLKTLERIYPFKEMCELYVQCYNRRAILLKCPDGQRERVVQRCG